MVEAGGDFLLPDEALQGVVVRPEEHLQGDVAMEFFVDGR